MSPSLRWWRFNIVGALGFAVQMAALALLHQVCGTHYLLASAAALELTLLHNFLWHLHYTWRDRRAQLRLRQLARFHISNGLVSLVGNLVIVRVLTGSLHMPLLAANAISVLCCAIANFYLGNIWAFAPAEDEQLSRKTRRQELVGPPGLEPGTNGL